MWTWVAAKEKYDRGLRMVVVENAGMHEMGSAVARLILALPGGLLVEVDACPARGTGASTTPRRRWCGQWELLGCEAVSTVCLRQQGGGRRRTDGSEDVCDALP